MATYALTVSTNALGLGVINGATVRIEKRRIAIADTYPPINNLIQIAQATNSSGIATFLLQPDDLTTYHVAKIFDTAGIFIYERFFSMPPSETSLDNTATGVLFGNSNIQFKDEGDNRGTPSSVRNVDFVGAGVEATFEGDTLRVFVQAGSQGFVAITDIEPTNPSDNVGNKVKTDDNNVLQSCTSSTTNVTVSVLAVTAGTSFKPTVTVNDVEATLTRNALTDVWTGTAAITLTGSSPHTVTATHSEGATDAATVTIEAAPVISQLEFSGAYSQGVDQTEHAAGQTLSLTVSSLTPFVELEVIADGTTATQAVSQTFAATTSKTLTVTVANQGNTPTAYPAKVRIRNANGTWSAITPTSNTIVLNNSQPVITFNSISYPASQQAIKSGESATVNVTETNVDTVSYTSTELTVTDPTTLGNKTVTYESGTYNISTNNLTVVATKTSNATTATFNTVVWIANTAPTITVTTPAARLRSPQSHTISINSNQRTLATPTLNASVGVFSGSWSTANNGLTWTRSLAIADSDTKGAANFSGLSITNLAGIEVTAITTGAAYTVGGFVQRTLTFPLWDANQIREVAIGTQVSDVTKLVAFNVTRNRATTYRATVGDEIDKFTITGGNTLYNCDLENASTAITSPVIITIEETVE